MFIIFQNNFITILSRISKPNDVADHCKRTIQEVISPLELNGYGSDLLKLPPKFFPIPLSSNLHKVIQSDEAIMCPRVKQDVTRVYWAAIFPNSQSLVSHIPEPRIIRTKTWLGPKNKPIVVNKSSHQMNLAIQRAKS